LSTQTLSQVEVEVSDEANSTASSFNEVLPPNLSLQHELELCNEHDNISKTYCKCGGGVVDCDFSKFSTHQLNHTMELSISGYAIPSTTRKVCICNAPNDLSLTFIKTFLPNRNKIHRFDLYNLKGDTRLDGAFSMFFTGDLYISNVTRIPEIHGYEFGRGYDDDKLENLQDMGCCSPIKVNQNFKKPLLFIENTAIGTINSGGVGDTHLWKTVIFKSVSIDLVQHYGISSFNTQTDVAIIKSIFTNVADSGIHLEGATNLFLAKSYFKLDSNHFAWSSKSKLKDSNVVLLGNTFWYPIIHEIDASRIVAWNNIYLTWGDNVTFNDMRFSSFTERFISIKYNIVTDNLVPYSIPFSKGSQVVLKENVLGSCNCSQYLVEVPFIKRDVNRCFAGNISDPSSGKCSLSLEAVVKACSKSSAPNFNEMCRDKSIATNSTFPGVGTDVMTGVEKARVNSTFITTIINEYPKLIGVNHIATTDGFLVNSENPWQDDESPANNDDGSSAHRTDSTQSGSGTAVTVTIILTVLVIVSVAVIIGYRNRHRFFGRSHQRLDASREVFI
ncbi:Pollen-specific leucine-rich repeat extensin-like protein 4, partial [Orchesella cincta]